MHAARFVYRGLLPAIVGSLFLFLAFGKMDAQAQAYYPPSQTNQFFAPNTNPNVPHNQHIFVQSIVIESIATGICLLSGYDVLSPTHQCLGIDPYTKRLGLAPVPKTNEGKPMLGGALGGMSYMIGSLYTHPPVSSIEYVHYMAGNFGFGENAYAQAGYTGYANLYDLRFLWEKFRNVAYGIMVIAFVIIGIAIMLRIRIDPRTVMTVQNQIPKIIIGILLITFSYAIAGFMVDLMWFATYFGIDAVTQTEKVKEEATNHIIDTPIFFADTVLRGISGISWDIGNSLGSIIADQLTASGDSCVGWDVWHPTFNPAKCLGDLVSWIGKYIFFFIVLAAILIALIRLWFILLKAYLFVILDVIAAPLWIAAGAIPGSSLNFSSWFRHLTAHLLLFPTAATVIVLARTLQEHFCPDFANDCLGASGDINNFFIAPLVGNPGSRAAFVDILVMAILLLLPQLLTILRDALHSKPLPYTAAVGTGFLAGVAVAGKIAKIPAKTASMAAKWTDTRYGSKRGWRSLFD